jgi:hypothetical protein
MLSIRIRSQESKELYKNTFDLRTDSIRYTPEQGCPKGLSSDGIGASIFCIILEGHCYSLVIPVCSPKLTPPCN